MGVGFIGGRLETQGENAAEWTLSLDRVSDGRNVSPWRAGMEECHSHNLRTGLCSAKGLGVELAKVQKPHRVAGSNGTTSSDLGLYCRFYSINDCRRVLQGTSASPRSHESIWCISVKIRTSNEALPRLQVQITSLLLLRAAPGIVITNHPLSHLYIFR